MTELPTYRYSGRIPFTGLVLGAAAGFVGGPLLAVLYTIAIRTITYVYLNFVLALALGGLIGYGVARAMTFREVRNPSAIMGLAVLSALVSHYVGWLVWVGLVVRNIPEFHVVSLLFPPVLFDAVGEIAQVGTWTFRGVAVHGVRLWIFWTIEALAVVVAAVGVAYFESIRRTYCEACGRWCTDHADLVRLSPVNQPMAAIVQQVEQGDLSILWTLSRAEPSAHEWIQLDLAACEGCGATNPLTVLRIEMRRDAKGNENEESTPLLYRFPISADMAKWLVGTARGSSDATAASAA